jgi:hypothetical protein
MKEEAKDNYRSRYILGSVLGIIGIIGFVFFVVFLFSQIKKQAPNIQIVVPGTHEIELSKPGKYTVFYEYRSVVEDRVYITGEALPAELLVTLYSRSGYNEVDLHESSMNNTYNMGSRAGISLLEFEVDNAGSYIIEARYAGNIEEPHIVLAIGQFQIFGIIFGAIGIFFLSLILLITGCIIVLVTYLKKRRLKRETEPGA